MTYERLKICILLLLAILCCGQSWAGDEAIRVYDQKHPLVYEDSWDLWPYVFLNESGEPDGYNIDLLKMLCSELGIPYVINLKPSADALRDLKDGKADLVFGMYADFHDEYGKYGSTILQLFTHSVVTPKAHPVTIRTLEDLGKHRVIVHANSYSHHLMIDHGWGDNAEPFGDMKEAIQRASSETEGQVVWNTMSLKWLMRKFQIENMTLTPIDMPHGEYRFMSNDETLLHRLDSTYSVLRSKDLLTTIQNKWFYPDRQESGIPSWVWSVAGVLALVALALIGYNMFYRRRERTINQLVRSNNRRLAQVLKAGQVRIWTYDIARSLFTLMDEAGNPTTECSAIEFSQRFSPEDTDKLYAAMKRIARMEAEQVTLNITTRREESNDDREHEFAVIMSVLRRDAHNKPTVLILTKRDITHEREKQRDATLLRSRYQAIFNTSMIDMAYFDKQGILTNVNEKLCRTFHQDRETLLKRRITIEYFAGVEGLVFNEADLYYATRILDLPEGDSNETSTTRRMYYELQLLPIFDSQRQLICVYGTGHDVTEFVNNYHKQQEGIQQTIVANKSLTQYVENINYALKMGGVRLVSYMPGSHTLTIYQDLDHVSHTLTQSRAVSLVDDSSKKDATRLLNSLDNLTTSPKSVDIKTVIRTKNGQQLHLEFHFIPVFDDNQQVVSYFGMCRDVSEIKATDLKLQQETARAQETEAIKNIFLKNMSYEIRTPLNAVVGFAEQFELDHSTEDEELFVAEIKKNSNFLLKLINDILFLSRLDAHMIEITPQPTDFSKTFESHCQTGWLNHQKEGVRYLIENPYEQLIVNVDDSNLGRIIEQIVSNATAHTTNGTVRTRYDYVGTKLLIAVEDTGSGINPQDLERIFGRFVSDGQGNSTGLGLPICRELAHQMGGTIDITSDLGKGTSVLITIPCQASVIERKGGDITA